MSKEDPLLVKILKSKWLGLGLTGVGLVQLLVVFGYLYLFAKHSIHNIFGPLGYIFMSFIVLTGFAFLGLITSLKIALLYKNEEELGIAVFGILLNMLIIIAFVKLPIIN